MVEARGEQVDLRVKDGTVMTFDTMAIVRSAEPIASQNEAAAEPEEGEDERFPKL